MFSEGISLASIRRQIEALERKCARLLAIYRLKPAVDQITELWNIAVAKNQPKPDPLTCVRKVVDAGFRLPTFTALHTYIKDCRKIRQVPRRQGDRRQAIPSRQESLPVRCPTRRLLILSRG